MQTITPRVNTIQRAQRMRHMETMESTARTTWNDGNATIPLDLLFTGIGVPAFNDARAVYVFACSAVGAKPSVVHGPTAGQSANSADVMTAATTTAAM